MPRVQVPKTERIRCPKQCKSMKGFYFYLELGLPPHPMQWSGARSPEPRFIAVFIGFRIESWQGLIGCRSFLVFTNWLIFIGCRGFLVFTSWLLAAGGCLLRPDKLTTPGIRRDDLTGQWLSLSRESYLSPWSLFMAFVRSQRIYPLFFGFPSLLGHHRALSRLLWAIQ